MLNNGHMMNSHRLKPLDVLPGAVHVLRLKFMHFYFDTINGEMNLQQSDGTTRAL